MKKWLFSNDGEISGPLELSEAKEFVKNNSELYAWHPSYTHWMPVTCIEEFKDAVQIPKPPSEVPKELIEQFIVKERTLIAKLDDIDKKLDLTTSGLSELDQEIARYKQLTINCNEEVRATIASIEQQYASLQASLSVFKQSAASNKSATSDVISQFKGQVTTTNSEDNSTEESPTSDDGNVSDADKSLNFKEKEIELAEDDQNPPQKTLSSDAPVSADSDQAQAEEEAKALKEAQALKEAEVLKEAQALKEAEALKEAQALKEAEALKEAQALKEAEALKVAQVANEQTTEPAKPSTLELLEQKLSRAKEKAKLSMVEEPSSPENAAATDNLVSMSRVEYVEDVSEDDIFMASKVKHISLTGAENLATFDKEPSKQDFSGDFDYILKGVYKDNGGVGEVVELESEPEPQKKRRRRRRR